MMELWKKRFNAARNSMLNKFVFLIISQMCLITFLWIYVFNDSSFKTPENDIAVVISRFICGFFLHISQEDEIKAAFKMMKYTTNHPWKFEHWFVAFLTNFMQAVVLILLEAVCIAVLIIQTSVLDVMTNFLALTIITELDDYFF